IHCWHILQHQPKWDSRFSQKKQKIHVDASPSTNSSQFEYNPDTPTSDPMVRPVGKKAEKEKRARNVSSSCTSESSLVVIALNNMWSEKKEMCAQAREERNDIYTQVLTLERERLQIEK
uniref:No apical meristem-associated C-terminal domain-containing protein n=1 Tax=Oryza brachyantha TaxID=4533 RepID=J3MRX5_ORYBR